MNEYHKIITMFKRDMENKGKTLLEGQWATPEFEYLADARWVFTEKVDGTNIRVLFQNHAVSFAGKSDYADIPKPLMERLTARFVPMQPLLDEVFQGQDAILYGEGYGAKIQKAGAGYRADQDFVLFDIRMGVWWLKRSDVEDVARRLALDVVPIIGEGTLHDAVAMTRAGFISTWGAFTAEGIVARPKVELKTRNGDRIITKIKHRDFTRR